MQLEQIIYRTLPEGEHKAITTAQLLERIQASGWAHQAASLLPGERKSAIQKLRRQLDGMMDNPDKLIGSDRQSRQQIYWRKPDPQKGLAYLIQELSLLQDVIKRGLSPKTQQDFDALLSKRLSHQSRWLNKLYVAPSGVWQPPVLDATTTELVYSAIEQELEFSCDYTNIQGLKRRVRLAPWGLMVKAEKVYVVARECGKNKPGAVTYAMISIENVELENPMQLSDMLDPAIDFKTYCEQEGMGQFAKGTESIVLTMRLYGNAGRRIHDTPLSTDMQVKEISHDCREVTATVHNSVELRKFLRGFGAELQVMAPEQLRSQMAEELKQALAWYQI
ncbi:WYL domain-containing protein [Alkalimonas sp. MEB108]|uniref:WYL domain-containing protein n=1 Tax=Alkalimonas cellulosilytica TaxID=3058395 RepID=A0ABU7JB97_9GAMM|nr:WYL domain-containing protein [Alkalimonas sp. MEB108]MEE2003155.1 WYL domain-containing protein [Alkalimonas sp. MEB108]